MSLILSRRESTLQVDKANLHTLSQRTDQIPAKISDQAPHVSIIGLCCHVLAGHIIKKASPAEPCFVLHHLAAVQSSPV